MIKGILLDLYGTLVVPGENSASGWLNEFFDCLRVYGLSLSKQAFSDRCQGFMSKDEPLRLKNRLTIYELRIQRFCKELGLEIDTAGIQRTAASTIEAANRDCFLDPDCYTVLEKLQQNKTLALVSNFDHSPHVKSLLSRMKLDQYFTTVIVSGEVGLKKPDPKIFRLALSRLGLKAEEVIHIGDDILDDIAGAISAGITPVLIRRNSTEANSLSKLLDDYPVGKESPVVPELNTIKTISRLTELLEIVQEDNLS